jgi:hypothetical protein
LEVRFLSPAPKYSMSYSSHINMTIYPVLSR